MDDLEHIEHKLSIPVATDIETPERLERIKTAMVNAIDRTDPASAITLQRYDEIDLMGFIRTVVDADIRQKHWNEHSNGSSITHPALAARPATLG